MRSAIALAVALTLTGCASNAQYGPPSTSAAWYGEASGFNIEVLGVETPTIHLYLNIKPEGQPFEYFQKLAAESEGSHYYHGGGYIGYRNSAEPLLVLTPEQARAVYAVATSEWARRLAAEYHLIGHNSNRWVVKILDRAGVAFDPPPGAIQ